LIRKAAAMKESQKGELYVLHVAKNEWKFLDSAKEGEALEYLFTISKSFGANMAVLKSDSIVKAIVDYARENKIDCIVMGESLNDHKENKFHDELKSVLNNVEIYEVPQVDF
jgi:K+-sensing histidine kinase KdpD